MSTALAARGQTYTLDFRRIMKKTARANAPAALPAFTSIDTGLCPIESVRTCGRNQDSSFKSGTRRACNRTFLRTVQK